MRFYFSEIIEPIAVFSLGLRNSVFCIGQVPLCVVFLNSGFPLHCVGLAAGQAEEYIGPMHGIMDRHKATLYIHMPQTFERRRTGGVFL